LTGVSFAIKSGQLVVIVGPNGSGKSTIVKILNRLYNPTAGEVLVDGQPMSSYRISDLRQGMADLSQDHSLYPLSIRENIGLGYSPCVSDIDMITRSAKLGGAFDLISKYEEGLDTTLHPVQTAYLGYTNGEHPLKDLYEKLEKQLDVSGNYLSCSFGFLFRSTTSLGGELQRLVAYVIFDICVRKEFRPVILNYFFYLLALELSCVFNLAKLHVLLLTNRALRWILKANWTYSKGLEMLGMAKP